mmetsp:Transcript_31175/g.62761  ORF Transcript_31175/g.62761 Transcript_31175/m.62761 type:complete len:703 (-) Transcript_31175:83-2191(-)
MYNTNQLMAHKTPTMITFVQIILVLATAVEAFTATSQQIALLGEIHGLKSSFVPLESTRRRPQNRNGYRVFLLRCDEAIEDESEDVSLSGNQWDGHREKVGSACHGESSLSTRRSFLLAATAAVALSYIPFTANASDKRLEEISLGTAKWNNAAASNSFSQLPSDARSFVSTSFAVYFARFLIHYDNGAAAWWNNLSNSYSLLSPSEVQRREGIAFGCFAYSIQVALYSLIAGNGQNEYRDIHFSDAVTKEKYLALFNGMVENYGGREDALRNIALLFAMLPPKYQPVEEMANKCGEVVRKAANSSTVTPENGRKNTSKLIAFKPLPFEFQQNYASLLPSNYQPLYSEITKSFTITPRISMSETAITEQSTSTFTTTFGPISSQPLSRERPDLSFNFYALLGLSGGAGCVLTHTLVIPLDVVKTRMQTNPGEYDGIFDGAASIAKKEGINSLFLGTQATIVGYLWYGVSVYPSYAFFKRFIGDQILSPAFAVAHADDVALIAGAMASVIASLGLTPIEACRIRAVAEPDVYRPLGLMGTLGVIQNEDSSSGWKNLYSGLPSLMTRQVIFGSVKFLAFERSSEAIFGVWPELRDATYTALGVSLVAGGFSGALSSVISQPADSILTYVAKKSSGGNLGILDGARMMIQEEGVVSLFRGLSSRCVWAGCIIAGQFLLYDVFRAMFGITGNDLNQVFEVALTIDG